MLNAFLSVAVPLVFFGLLGASVWYVDARLRGMLGYRSCWQGRLGSAITLVALVVAIGATATSASRILGGVYLVGGYVFAFYLFLLLTLLVWHVVPCLRTISRQGHGVLVLGIAAAATVWGSLMANTFVVREQVIHLAGLKAPVSIVHITDVHLGHHRGRAYLEAIVAATNELRPDWVVITGDLVESHIAIKSDVLAPLSRLVAPAFFVNGNHENYTDPARVFKLVAAQGVRVLRNERVEVGGLHLIGLDYLNADDDAVDLHASSDERTIEAVLPGLSSESAKPSVLLHHSPVGVNYVERAGINLMLSGHTHGGQFFPGTWLTSALFRFSDGLYNTGKTQVFVSAGAGTFLSRFRLGSRNEIAHLRLIPLTEASSRER